MKAGFPKIRFRYLLAIVAAFALATACSPRARSGPRIISHANLYKIGLAIRQFELTNGALPVRLSEIVPRFIPLDQIGLFYITNRPFSTQELPQGWQTDPNLIDAYSSYNYLGTNNVHGVIAFERTNLWKATMKSADQVAVLFSDYHVQRIPIVKLQALIGQANGQDQM